MPRRHRIHRLGRNLGEIKYTAWERLTQEMESYRHGVQHELVKELRPGEVLRRCCPSCRRSAATFPEHMAYVRKPNASTAYIEALASVILDSLKHDDVFRRLYGVLTGNCGMCGAVLTDPTSKLLGIGPDCGGRR